MTIDSYITSINPLICIRKYIYLHTALHLLALVLVFAFVCPFEKIYLFTYLLNIGFLSAKH